MLARHGAGLVHDAGAGHENGEATWAQAVDRAGDEVVMQAQPELCGQRVGFDDAVREWRVADGQVEAAAKRGARVVLPPHARLRMDQRGDACGDRIVFDAGEARAVAQRLRHQGEEQPGAHARFEDPPCTEAEMLGGAPDGPDHRLGRVMGVLCRALQGGVFRDRGGVGEVVADLLPAGPQTRLARQRKGVLRQVGRAEADEAHQLFLLGGRGRAPGILQFPRQADRGDIVAGAGRPAAGKLPIAGQCKVHPLLRRSERGGRVRLIIGIRRHGYCCRHGHRPTQRGAVEQAKRVLRCIGHRVSPGRVMPHRCANGRSGGHQDGWGTGSGLGQPGEDEVSTRPAASACRR